MQSRRYWMLGRTTIAVGIFLASVLNPPHTAVGQALTDVTTPDTPLVLKAQGSFFVGGEQVEQTRVQLGSFGPGGHITVSQMYVRFMVPQDGPDNVPVVMVHGATLTGKSWETTPDGRMGWDEYFVRNGHPVYVPDQVGRGRSGFNQARFNDVRAGVAPATDLCARHRSTRRAGARNHHTRELRHADPRSVSRSKTTITRGRRAPFSFRPETWSSRT